MDTAEQRGEGLSEVLRAALGAYRRDPDGYWQVTTPARTDGPSVPSFSHSPAPVRPWRWTRPLGYEHAKS